MSNNKIKPLVGVLSDVKEIEPHRFHVAGDKYLRALTTAADVVPVLIPAMLEEHDAIQWLSRLDGLFLTGAYSMVDPALYGEAKIDKPYDYDSARDSGAHALLKLAVEMDIPLLGVCRGLQDLNVFMGGSLHQAVQEEAGLNDHREDKSVPLEQQYADAHDVKISEAGMLSRIYNKSTIRVNSLHSQGINRLGAGLAVEATANDGLIEAIRVESMTFGLAVQWHPEWKVIDNPVQKLLFEAFGEVCKTRQSLGKK